MAGYTTVGTERKTMLNRGSEWSRWDPHIHTPGTLLNDQFRGSDCWDSYLASLEAVEPSIRAVGITDYYLTANYERVLEFKASGHLPNVQLMFPNVEMRLDVSAKSGFINIHLLVSPEEPNHVQELTRILSRLTFSVYADRFACTRDELIRTLYHCQARTHVVMGTRLISGNLS